MKKIVLLILVITANIYTLPKKPWTTFFYLAGHNGLWGHLKHSILNSLPKATSKNVNIISSANLFADCNEAPPDNCTPTTQVFIATPKRNIQTEPTQNNLNTGLQSTLIDQLTIAIQKAPSNMLAIFLCGHGGGPATGLCSDNGQNLHDNDVQNALKTAITLRKKKIDILIVDCCIMASLEYYFSWAPYTNFLIGSQEVDPGDGIPYKSALEILKKTTNTKAFALNIVNAFYKKYIFDQNQQQFTLSVLNAKQVRSICVNLNNISKQLLSLLTTNKNLTFNLIRKSINQVTRFPGIVPGGQIDLKNFYMQLLKNAKSPVFNNLKKLLKQGIVLINRAVILNRTKIPNANGISIFFPKEYCCAANYLNTQFNKTFPYWVEFLKVFLTK